MSKKAFAFFVSAIILASLFIGFAYADNSDEVVIKELQGHVISADKINVVKLIGSKTEDSPYYKNIKIVIYDKDGKVINTITPSVNEGYGPNILLADFGLNDGTVQIYYGASTGGSGGFGYFDVFSAKDNKVRKIFDTELFNRKNVYTGRYIDNYKVEVTKARGKDRYIIDLSLRPKEYKDQIWNTNGKLLKPIGVDISEVNTVFPYFNYLTNTYQLIVYQRITGLYNADGLGYIITQLAYENGAFRPFFTGLMIFPS